MYIYICKAYVGAVIHENHQRIFFFAGEGKGETPEAPRSPLRPRGSGPAWVINKPPGVGDAVFVPRRRGGAAAPPGKGLERDEAPRNVSWQHSSLHRSAFMFPFFHASANRYI